MFQILKAFYEAFGVHPKLFIAACATLGAIVFGVFGYLTVRAEGRRAAATTATQAVRQEQDAFGVAIETAIVGETRDSVFVHAEYNERWLTPVPVMLFVRIVNVQDIPATISQLRVEIQSDAEGNVWLPTTRITEYMRLLSIGNAPQNAQRLYLIGDLLQPILEAGPIEPHATVRGWVLFDVPQAYDKASRPLTYRITVGDTAGRQVVAIDRGPTGQENVFPSRGLRNAPNERVDVRRYTLKHLSDPVP